MQLWAEVDGQILSKQCSGTQVVTVGEAAWNDEKGVVEQGLRGLEQSVDMNKIGLEPDQAACMGGLTITVDARSA
jgi:hypothetical protein